MVSPESSDLNYEAAHRQRLLRHAEKHASALGSDPLITGIVIGGSLAHGGADRESDLDMLVIVRDLPSVEKRACWLQSVTGREIAADSLAATEEREWDEFGGPKDEPEQWMGTGGGLFYFPEHEILDGLERIGELLLGFIGRDELERPSHLEEYLADLAHGVILHDPRGFVAGCQQRLAQYPEAARIRLINYHWHMAEIAVFEDLQRAVWRSDFVHAHDRRVEGIRHLVRMLFAMNRRYFRKAKALDQVLPTFEACPPDAWDRFLRGLLEPDLMRAAAILLALARDIILLVQPADILEGREHWVRLCTERAQEYGIAEPGAPSGKHR